MATRYNGNENAYKRSSINIKSSCKIDYLQ
jgi:hypothetical protein